MQFVAGGRRSKFVLLDHERLMRIAIAEAERARGRTGDNPWVGCVIAGPSGEIVARGYTQGPGEDHAEIVAMAEAAERGVDLSAVTLYSTLEPCAFHGRTPACARAIVARGVRRVVVSILDPNPRVDGAGLRILREAGVDVVEHVCANDVVRQLAAWLLHYHPHEPERRARALHDVTRSRAETERLVRDLYGLDAADARELVDRALAASSG